MEMTIKEIEENWRRVTSMLDDDLVNEINQKGTVKATSTGYLAYRKSILDSNGFSKLLIVSVNNQGKVFIRFNKKTQRLTIPEIIMMDNIIVENREQTEDLLHKIACTAIAKMKLS